MAEFENVNYEFYSVTLGRSIVPTEAEFNALKLENIQVMKRLLPYVLEREDNGIDKAVCLMIEKDYQNQQLKTGAAAGAIASESLGGHSVSYGSSATNRIVEADIKGTDAARIEAIKLFCSLDIGVC